MGNASMPAVCSTGSVRPSPRGMSNLNSLTPMTLAASSAVTNSPLSHR